MSVSCECCVLSGRGLCDGLITNPENTYRVCSRYLIEEEGLGPLELSSHKVKELLKTPEIFYRRGNQLTS
jgi:hypothetical protein